VVVFTLYVASMYIVVVKFIVYIHTNNEPYETVRKNKREKAGRKFSAKKQKGVKIVFIWYQLLVIKFY
jgi:hypothetical protein